MMIEKHWQNYDLIMQMKEVNCKLMYYLPQGACPAVIFCLTTLGV